MAKKKIIVPGDIEFEDILSEVEDAQTSPAKYEISTYPADFTLQVLHGKWDKPERDISIPDFQRQFVWNVEQASKLIESFLLDLPVPPIYLYKERKSQKLLVIDGQQRLKSIFYFFEGFFDRKKRGQREEFRLKGLNEKSPYFNKAFKEFSDSDKRKLQDCVLRAFIVQQLDPKDDTSVYHIFERLNTGGTLLTNQEVRNCIYHGSFNKTIVELNKNKDWRKILGKDELDSRQKDVELILRFFALLDVAKYSKPMKEFLTNFMIAHRDPSDDFLEKISGLFRNACHEIADKIGEKPFHIKAGINTAVCDSVMAAFAHNLKKIPGDIKGRYEKLKKDTNFLNSVSGSTTDVEMVNKRFERAITILFSR